MTDIPSMENRIISLELLIEYKGETLHPDEPHYTIFIKKGTQLFPVFIPWELATDIPPWSKYSIKDPNQISDE